VVSRLAMDARSPVDFQLVDNPLHAIKPLYRFLSHLLLEKRRYLAVQDDNARFFLKEDLVAAEVRVPLDGRVHAMNQI
jgi:hypothetical protein